MGCLNITIHSNQVWNFGCYANIEHEHNPLPSVNGVNCSIHPQLYERSTLFKWSLSTKSELAPAIWTAERTQWLRYVTFFCVASQVTWRRHSESHPLTIGLFPFAPDPRLSVDFNQRTNEWSLIIQDVRPSDGGLYHCQVTSKDEHDSSFEVRLKVKSKSIAVP